MTEPAEPAEPNAEADASPWGVGRILAVSVGIALVLFWIWIFAGGPAKRNPDYLHDRDWVKWAQMRCEASNADIGALPGPETTPDHVERAVVVDKGTDRLERLVDDLAERPSGDDRDARVIDPWIADYRTYIQARRDYAKSLRADAAARLLLPEKFKQPLDDVINTFAADVNHMPDCQVPGDVA